MTQHPHDRDAAFLTLVLGGTGKIAAPYIRNPYEQEKRPYRMTLVYADTDRGRCEAADRSMLIPMSTAKLDAFRANAPLYGQLAPMILRACHRLIDPEDFENGSRTVRPLTQLCFLFHEQQILAALRAAILDLIRQGGVASVVPVFVSSSGGGAGSAFQVLLALALKDAVFRSRLLEGLPDDILKTPISFVSDPFAQAGECGESQANRVLGNAYAFRLESARLAQANAFKYVIHLGFANASGTVLDSREEIARVLGSTVYLFQRNWSEIKSQLVNAVDADQHRRYKGLDAGAPATETRTNGVAH